MEASKPSVAFVKSSALPPSPGYSQAVRVEGGRTVYIAGQVAIDRSGAVVGGKDFRAQVQQTFENLEAALSAAGARFQDVVKLTSYFTDITQIPVFREVRDKFIDTRQPPATTAVEVRRLFREDFLIEVEAIAVVSE
jgi:reactive intermediate/imine deaminase